MLSITERSKIVSLIQQEVIPAIGCTEPIAVALAVAKVKELLNTIPEKIDVYLSANVLKNAMGVGIPGTGMVGLPIAIALGAIVGKPEYGLEVLREVTPEAVESGKELIEKKITGIHLKKDITEKIKQAVVLENAYADDCLPRGILGLNAPTIKEYVQYIADRRLERIGLEKVYGSENPFPWMSEMIDLKKEKNF